MPCAAGPGKSTLLRGHALLCNREMSAASLSARRLMAPGRIMAHSVLGRGWGGSEVLLSPLFSARDPSPPTPVSKGSKSIISAGPNLHMLTHSPKPGLSDRKHVLHPYIKAEVARFSQTFVLHILKKVNICFPKSQATSFFVLCSDTVNNFARRTSCRGDTVLPLRYPCFSIVCVSEHI